MDRPIDLKLSEEILAMIQRQCLYWERRQNVPMMNGFVVLKDQVAARIKKEKEKLGRNEHDL